MFPYFKNVSETNLRVTFNYDTTRWNNTFCILKCKSRHRRCSVKMVFRNFTKFTGKHLCQRLSCKASNFIKEEPLAQVFSAEFCQMFKNTFFTEHFRTTASENEQIDVIIRFCNNSKGIGETGHFDSMFLNWPNEQNLFDFMQLSKQLREEHFLQISMNWQTFNCNFNCRSTITRQN